MLCKRCAKREGGSDKGLRAIAEELHIDPPLGLCAHCLVDDREFRKVAAAAGEERIKRLVGSVRAGLGRSLNAIDEWVDGFRR